jgi:uncharacterized protein
MFAQSAVAIFIPLASGLFDLPLQHVDFMRVGLNIRHLDAIYTRKPNASHPVARTSDESRWLLVGKIDEKHWSAMITRRGVNIRVISVRRSRDEEVALYESEDI